MTYRKKLIEVDLPLEKINEASAREKSIRHGHPSTLHLWWSRKPLATCRAVLFASLVDDPSEHPEKFPTEEAQEVERKRLFGLIEELVKWENSNDKKLLEKVREEIRNATNGNPPPVLDPFAGGGSIPLEAQRLGLEAHASDLNPVAVLINKALIEIPPKFAGQAPVNPEARKALVASEWQGAQGLADDIRYYGKWMRDEAEKRIGHLYPKVTLPKEYGGGEATVIAWLWARTVTCPNPACSVQMPLTNKWWLSKKAGKETWAEPYVDYTITPPTIHFTIKSGKDKPQEGTVNRQGAKCIACSAPVSFDHIRNEGKNGKMGQQLMAIVAEGQRGRAYLAPEQKHAIIASQATPEWTPQADLPHNSRDFKTPNYGMPTFGDLFTSRQLVALTTFSDLIQEVRAKVLLDSHTTNTSVDRSYADAVATHLAFIIDKLADLANQLCGWEPVAQCPRHLFGRQAIPMIWDFAEGNPFGTSSGSWAVLMDNLIGSMQSPLMSHERLYPGLSQQKDAVIMSGNSQKKLIISTDPPYYDNISYADLSDFFYVWLRGSLVSIYPDLFDGILTPKKEELVATPYRFNGNKVKAREFFEDGLKKAFEQMRAVQNPDYPLTVYYAFKQAESEIDISEEDHSNNGNGAHKKKNKGDTVTASTGWETMLEGLIGTGFTITGTWPMRTEMGSRMVGMHTNALASSIVLVCRPRDEKVVVASRRQFLNELKAELPRALRKMLDGSIAPVDLAQASIGPGMVIYSRYSKVVEADGTPLKVRTALQLINKVLDDFLFEVKNKVDMETSWAIAWFENFAMKPGSYKQAALLAKEKNITIQCLEQKGIIKILDNKISLRIFEPLSKNNTTFWGILQQSIYAVNNNQDAIKILLLSEDNNEIIRDLIYLLYLICDRKKWAKEALPFNKLGTLWTKFIKQSPILIS